jgi:hypothetical protein
MCPGKVDDRAPGKERQEMAMIRVEPVDVQVRTDWFDGRPREITWRDERLPVTGVASVRHEDAAYPVATGPRTLFEVTTRRARFALSYRHRSRRWTLEGVEDARLDDTTPASGDEVLALS